MKTKKILSIAIIAALPFGAHADPVGPAAVPANGTPVVATANAPYVTQTPTAADATHIASTAYVKGAYNDAIAAVNKVANTVDGKQAQLVNANNNNAMYNKVMTGGMGVGGYLVTSGDGEYAAMREDVARQLSNNETSNPGDILISAGAVMDIVRGAGQEKQKKLVNSGNNHAMYDTVVSSSAFTGLGGGLVYVNDQDYASMADDIARGLSGGETSNPDETLISTGATLQIVREVGRYLDGKINTAQNSVNNKRVDIYTTWENDNATTQVPLSFAPAQ